MNSLPDDRAVERRRAQNRLAQRKLRQRRAKLEQERQEQQQQQQQQIKEARRNSQSHDNESSIDQNALPESCTYCRTQEDGLSVARESKKDARAHGSHKTVDNTSTLEELHDQYTLHNAHPDQTTCSVSHIGLPMNCETMIPASDWEDLHDFEASNTFGGILLSSDVASEIEDTSGGSSEIVGVLPTPASSIENKRPSYNIDSRRGLRSMSKAPTMVTKLQTGHPPIERPTEPDYNTTRRTSTSSLKWAAPDSQQAAIPTSPTVSANRGKMALHLCAERGNTKMVHFLLNYGAEIDTLDAAGRSALHYAARNSHAETVAKLLERGADTEILDCQGLTPLHVAANVGCEEVICLLVQEGADLNTRIELQ